MNTMLERLGVPSARNARYFAPGDSFRSITLGSYLNRVTRKHRPRIVSQKEGSASNGVFWVSPFFSHADKPRSPSFIVRCGGALYAYLPDVEQC